MSSKNGDTTRRRLLKSIGVTGLALGTVGVASAEDGEVKEIEASPKDDDGATTEGYWEYKCTQIVCPSGGRARYRRYCSSGQCSGWEPTDECC